MEQKAPYRNAVRSKRMIQEAYLQLLMKKDISRIKTIEVIELADVSKGTFYSHYTCLFDVQSEIEDQQLALMFRTFVEQEPELFLENLYPLFLCGLTEIENKRELYRILFHNSHGNSFLLKLKNTFYSFMHSCNASKNPPLNHRMLDTYLTYVAGGAIAVIQDWLEEPKMAPAHQISKQLSNFAMNGINTLHQINKERHAITPK